MLKIALLVSFVGVASAAVFAQPGQSPCLNAKITAARPSKQPGVSRDKNMPKDVTARKLVVTWSPDACRLVVQYYQREKCMVN